MARPLTPRQAAAVYDRLSRIQDWQSFYEGPAIDELLRHADFSHARSVYELGPGTGALAWRLLKDFLPPDGQYRGVDVSPTMVRLSRERLHRWAERARVDEHDGSFPFPGDANAYDRFLSVYVFDIFPGDYAIEVCGEAHRLLGEDGRLCLISLTEGTSRVSAAVSRLWRRLWDVDARLVGGCRPIELTPLLSATGWRIEHRATVEAWGMASEVVVAAPSAA